MNTHDMIRVLEIAHRNPSFTRSEAGFRLFLTVGSLALERTAGSIKKHVFRLFFDIMIREMVKWVGKQGELEAEFVECCQHMLPKCAGEPLHKAIRAYLRLR